MGDLYRRLSRVGFDQDFVRDAILPDWWDDSAAEVPFNRAIAEAAISGHLGYAIKLLREPDAELPLPDTVGVCFKRNTKVNAKKTLPALQVVTRTAELVTRALKELPKFVGEQKVGNLRQWITNRHRVVDLGAVLDACWSHGIPVIGVSNLPKKSARFDGVATYRGDRPVIVLASGKDEPSWLAFHLAHELGHVMLGHVKQGEGVFVDTDLKSSVDDYAEVDADEFALELLTGNARGLEFRSTRLKSHELGKAAANYAEEHQPGVAAGSIVLSYCKSTTFWGVAKGALESIGSNTGALSLVAQRLLSNLDVDALTEGAERFLVSTCRLPQSCPSDERRIASR